MGLLADHGPTRKRLASSRIITNFPACTLSFVQAGCILGLSTSSEIFTFKLNNEDHMEVFPLRYVVGIRELTSMQTSKLTEMKTELLISEPEDTLTSCELHVHHHPAVHISLNVICLDSCNKHRWNRVCLSPLNDSDFISKGKWMKTALENSLGILRKGYLNFSVDKRQKLIPRNSFLKQTCFIHIFSEYHCLSLDLQTQATLIM